MPGNTSKSILDPILPDNTVPVTIVPNPTFEKTRSIGIWKKPRFGEVSKVLDEIIISFFKSSIPSFFITDVRKIGASLRKVFDTSSRNSNSIKSIQSKSLIKSVFVIAIIPFFNPRSFKICKCSFVCGIIPSSAATTRSAISIVDTPATIFLINFS